MVYGFVQGIPGGSTPTTVHESSSFSYTQTTAPSFQDLIDLNNAMCNGTAPPSIFSFVSNGGRVKAVLTGVEVQSPHEQQLSVTVIDDIADLDDAWLYLGSQQIAHASRQQGTVVDRNFSSIATLTAFVPAEGPVDVRVTWEGASSILREASSSYADQ
jgi:hypothetical protein